MCEECTNQDGKFCPQNLFYLDSVKKTDQEDVGIRFKFKEIGKCQGCLKCEKLCPEKAIIPIILNST
jgi:NAD-dependent dihydropyrimidine dehydrogenase PreA subunit